MGWSVGYDPNWNRDIGYGVPAICDDPECSKEIDRGLSHVCGGEPFGGEHGCGLCFCRKHLRISDEGRQVCVRCNNGWKPCAPKPDIAEWIKHKLTDPTWTDWRAENPEEVAALSKRMAASAEVSPSPNPPPQRRRLEAMSDYGPGETIRRGWIIIHEPGRNPGKKCPHPQTDDGLDAVLVELTKLYPTASFTVCLLTWDDDLWIEDGAERLAIKASLDSLTAEDWAEIDAMHEDALAPAPSVRRARRAREG